MRRLLFIGIMLLTVFSTSCASPGTSGDSPELNRDETGSAKKEIADEEARYPAVPGLEGTMTDKSHDDSGPAESAEGAIGGDVPGQFSGTGEDEWLKVHIRAKMEADRRHYETNVAFSNKSSSSLNLLFDCGLLISNDHFEPNPGVCPAVESMLLKKNGKEAITVNLPAAYLNSGDAITVRYRHGKQTNELEIYLQSK